MHSFLIVSKNKKSALEHVRSECKNNKIDKFDLSIYFFEKLVGIDDIRQIQKKLILKPMLSKTKAIVLETHSGITIEGQNAILKVLEEPPANTLIYITIQNKDLLLPTILSRCKVIELKDSYELSKEESAKYLNLLISLFNKSIGERLKLAQDVTKNKDETIPCLEKMILVTREELIKQISSFWGDPLSGTTPESPTAMRDSGRSASWRIARMTETDEKMVFQYLNLLISLNKTYTILKTTNANQRLVLENLFLSI